MVLYLPNFSLVFLIHVFLYAGVYCIITKQTPLLYLQVFIVYCFVCW